MRKLAFLAPLGLTLAMAVPALADPAAVNVTIGADVRRDAAELGRDEVDRQTERLAQVVTRELSHRGALDGATLNLVVTSLKPNRPTFEQMARRPGLDGHRSLSTGGASIEGEIITADGERIPVSYDWFSYSIAEVQGFTTWQDADRAYARFADNLAEGRYAAGRGYRQR